MYATCVNREISLWVNIKTRHFFRFPGRFVPPNQIILDYEDEVKANKAFKTTQVLGFVLCDDISGATSAFAVLSASGSS